MLFNMGRSTWRGAARPGQGALPARDMAFVRGRDDVNPGDERAPMGRSPWGAWAARSPMGPGGEPPFDEAAYAEQEFQRRAMAIPAPDQGPFPEMTIEDEYDKLFRIDPASIADLRAKGRNRAADRLERNPGFYRSMGQRGGPVNPRLGKVGSAILYGFEGTFAPDIQQRRLGQVQQVRGDVKEQEVYAREQTARQKEETRRYDATLASARIEAEDRASARGLEERERVARRGHEKTMADISRKHSERMAAIASGRHGLEGMIQDYFRNNPEEFKKHIGEKYTGEGDDDKPPLTLNQANMEERRIREALPEIDENLSALKAEIEGRGVFNRAGNEPVQIHVNGAPVDIPAEKLEDYARALELTRQDYLQRHATIRNFIQSGGKKWGSNSGGHGANPAAAGKPGADPYAEFSDTYDQLTEGGEMYGPGLNQRPAPEDLPDDDELGQMSFEQQQVYKYLRDNPRATMGDAVEYLRGMQRFSIDRR